MASIARRPDGAWRARYRGPDRQERSKHFVRKVDAQRWLDSATATVVTGAWTAPERARVTVGEWSAQWLTAQSHLKPSTRSRYAGIVRKQVAPTWERVPLSKVTHADVAAWVSQLDAQGLAASTVRQAHRVLSLILELAVRDDRLARNPATGVGLPKAARPPKRFLTRREVQAVAEGAGQDGDIVLTLALTGLRFGELVALRVGCVDLLRRRLEVRESASEVEGRLEWGTTKTHQRRSVPVPRSLVEALAVRCAGRGPDDLVFTAPGGGPVRLNNWRRRVFLPAVRAANLIDVSPHDLRHTAASLAVGAGASVLSVQRMLGHRSAAMTLDVYSGLFDDDLDAVADKIDGAAADSVRTGADVMVLPRATEGR